ncbi:hypothetical protein M3Y94_00671900 [Aphelenchoides besseyi]|nr:hypothetical protein M3Y94_00671900 [Aphelenchoides besseyi]
MFHMEMFSYIRAFRLFPASFFSGDPHDSIGFSDRPKQLVRSSGLFRCHLSFEMIGPLVLLIFLLQFDFLSATKCYSCASENMRENFLTRSRGPQKRIHEPRLYDDMCDLDTWLIREKSAVDCQSPCFKWQQILF